MKPRLLLAPVYLLTLVLGAAFIRSAAPTYDEPVHLASGWSYLATGRYRLNILDHPPLAEMWAAAALVPLRPALQLSHPDWIGRRVYHYSDHFLYRNRVPPGRMLDAARLFNLATLSLALLAGLWAWAGRRAGDAAGLAAAAAAALSPLIVSNLALVTTDGASAVLFFLVFCLLSDERARSPRRWAGAGALAGLALASKFNMVLLLPLVPACLAVERWRRKGPFPWGGLALFYLCAGAALAAVYRLDLGLYWEGLSATFRRLDQGRASFLAGRHSTEGFALYFPIALAAKTPLAVLGLAAAGAALWAREGRSAVWALLPPAAYLAAAQTSKVQIGARHLLPALPFLALAAGEAWARLWERRRAAAAGLGLWAAASVGFCLPHLLAYFNEAAGGPGNGHRILVDSNLDWGQGLKGLAEAVRRRGDPPIYLSYFGVADPAAYGLRYLPVAFVSNVTRAPAPVDPAASGRVLLAVSATNRQAVYFADKSIFAWLDGVRPVETVGHSIFLYDLTGDRRARERLARLVAASGFADKAKSLVE